MATEKKVNELSALIDKIDELAEEAENKTVDVAIKHLKEAEKTLTGKKRSTAKSSSDDEEKSSKKTTKSTKSTKNTKKAEEEAEEDVEETDLSELKTQQLKDIAKDYGVSTSGTKKALVTRIEEFEKPYYKYLKKDLDRLINLAEKRDVELKFGRVKKEDKQKHIAAKALAHYDLNKEDDEEDEEDEKPKKSSKTKKTTSKGTRKGTKKKSTRKK